MEETQTNNTTQPSTNRAPSGLDKKIKANKTPLLIIILAVFTGILLIVALSPKTPTTTTPPAANQAATAPAEATLSFGNATSSGSVDNVDVIADTGKATATAVQLEMSFDPKLISNITITPGDFAKDWDVLLNKIDYANGRISYAIGIPLSGGSLKGTGAVAHITFTETGTTGQTVELNLLPKSLVSIEGYAGSSLKSTSNFSKVIGQSTTSAAPSATASGQ